MEQFSEAIKMRDGIPCLLSYHNERLNRTRREVFGCHDVIDVAPFIEVPPNFSKGVVKCRIVYSKELLDIQFSLYRIRTINTLKLVDGKDIDYQYKSIDRSSFDSLKNLWQEFDDILIEQNGLITDTSFSNIAFYDGKKWITPAIPLLKGTKRQKLLDDTTIIEGEIRAKNLHKFEKALLFNSMIDWEDQVLLNIEQIT